LKSPGLENRSSMVICEAKGSGEGKKGEKEERLEEEVEETLFYIPFTRNNKNLMEDEFDIIYTRRNIGLWPV